MVVLSLPASMREQTEAQAVISVHQFVVFSEGSTSTCEAKVGNSEQQGASWSLNRLGLCAANRNGLQS